MPNEVRHPILFVIPAKAGIQSIHKEEWIPFYKGMTEENPGSPIRSGMTKRDKEGMTKRVDSLLQGNDRGSREGQTLSVIPHLIRDPGFMNLLLEKVRKVIIPKIRFAVHIETCFLTD